MTQVGAAGPGARRRRLVIETDGGSRGNPGPAGYGVVVREEPGGSVLAKFGGYLGVVTNNVAEYTGLVEGLRAAHDLDPEADVEVRSDSRLLVEQMSGRWQVKHADMRRLVREAHAAFEPARVSYTWVPRDRNRAADALANKAMDARGDIGTRGTTGAADDGEDANPAADAQRTAAEPLPTAEGEGPTVTVPRALGATPLGGGADAVNVVLVRHGQTDQTAARLYAGGDGPGSPLNARGRIEAAQVADLVRRIGAEVWPDLPKVSAVLTSSMLRTRETAVALGRRLGVHPSVDDSFAECRFGAWEGLSAEEIDRQWPGRLGRWYEDPESRAPAGESMWDVARRVRSGLDALGAEYAGRTVAVATHTVTIRAGVGALIGLNPAGWSRLRVPPASVTILRLWPDGHEVTTLGCPSDL